jgi:hypothetical protein
MMKMMRREELKIPQIEEFVRDQIVEKNFVDEDKMMLIDHSMRKISMNYDCYSLVVIIPSNSMLMMMM